MAHILEGKTITQLEIAADKMALRFSVEGHEPIIAKTDGDCCSHSWIESVEIPALGFPAKVLKVEELDTEVGGELDIYGIKIVTDKGDLIIDFRNESNGYYSGNMWWPKEDPEEYNGFYGGVYGQNVSKEEWKPLAEVF